MRESGLRKLLRVKAAGISGLPGAYRRADWLECTGSNAKIDTGIPGNDESLRFLYDYMPLSNVDYSGHFGNYDGEDKACWRVIQSTSAYSRYYIFSANNRRADSSGSIAVVPSTESSYVGHRITFDLSCGSYAVKCGDYEGSGTLTADASVRSALNICIGAVRPPATGGTFKGRFWNFRIWSGGALVRDYVPCVRKSDSKAGFYDLVGRTFNPSIGSADFVAGFDE